jgi:hypothetical protein
LTWWNWKLAIINDAAISFSDRGAHRKMKNQTETLGVGSSAPQFALSAANREGSFSLVDLISRGPIIVEFLRGTW